MANGKATCYEQKPVRIPARTTSYRCKYRSRDVLQYFSRLNCFGLSIGTVSDILIECCLFVGEATPRWPPIPTQGVPSRRCRECQGSGRIRQARCLRSGAEWGYLCLRFDVGSRCVAVDLSRSVKTTNIRAHQTRWWGKALLGPIIDKEISGGWSDRIGDVEEKPLQKRDHLRSMISSHKSSSGNRQKSLICCPRRIIPVPASISAGVFLPHWIQVTICNT
ncbi:hypothetical protein QBC40DRAFT_301910 [Triangularia verruculosa]|uniref:Uncharacterized protein n=1 Tax=Triangularia verruculosa TaxID=2587418 RepID=A0AAN6X7Y3_9PEZI|nr:hypothetical protein QBC40DRAFT_301910 [Triangularia verruculosa]